MGADPEHGRRRGCSRDCCQPNTRAQEREAVRGKVAVSLKALAAEQGVSPITSIDDLRADDPESIDPDGAWMSALRELRD